MESPGNFYRKNVALPEACLLYTSDAADERSSVDLGGRRIIKKQKKEKKNKGDSVYHSRRNSRHSAWPIQKKEMESAEDSVELRYQRMRV